jgi:hypothetical protein
MRRPGRRKWSIVVHRQEPEIPKLDRIIALCPSTMGW